MKTTIKELKNFLFLWSTQALSALGSSMTSFALGLWLYEKTGSALQTALLNICTFAPYVLVSIFAGALSDRWNKKKVMLVCDVLAACASVTILILLKKDLLVPWHIYLLNILSGLMNTVQQPAGDVAMTLITPKKHFQRTSGMRSFSNSLVTILHPVIATAFYAFGGMDAVIFFDLSTFLVAFLVLLFGIKIPNIEKSEEKESISVFRAAGEGISYLKKTPLIFTLIAYMAGINFIASMFEAVIPAYVLPKTGGNEQILGVVTSMAGIGTLLGSLFVTASGKPKNRLAVIYLSMLFSMSIEYFIFAFGKEPWLWYLGQFVGWFPVPFMGANLDVILRTTIPMEMQGRVYSCRNTLQYFMIPIGYFLGGFFVDNIFEPMMALQAENSLMSTLFGFGKGSGAAIVALICGILGTLWCGLFGKLLHRYEFKDE